MFSQYDATSKMFIILLAFLLPLVYLVTNRCEQKIFHPNKRLESIDKNILYSFAIQHNISMKHSVYASSRVLVATTLFYTLVISAIYQSTIVKNLNTNQELGKINTIEELKDEGYTIKMPRYLALVFTKPGLDKVSTMIRKTKQNVLDVGVASIDPEEILVPGKKMAFLWTDLYNTNYLNRFYDKSTGENYFECVPEVAFEFYISLMAPKSSPFIERFNEILLRLVESGIGDYNVHQAIIDNDSFWIRRVKNGEIPKKSNRAINLTDIWPVIKFHLIWNAGCFMCFLSELVIKRLINIWKK